MTKQEVKIRAIKDSISHWKRMIEYAKTQPPTDYPDISIMKHDINENWYGNYCSLCRFYEEEECCDCPLAKKYGDCNDEDLETSNKNLWCSVNDSSTWKEWIKNAKKFLKQIKSLLDGDE